jgi:type IV pilus assembly protein PilB
MAAEAILNLSGLAKRLIADGVIDEVAVRKAYQETAKTERTWLAFLVEQQQVSSRLIAECASEEFGVPLFLLESMDVECIPKGLVQENLIRKHHALPLFKRGNRLFIGVADPSNLQGLDDIKFNTGLTTEPIVVEQDKLSQFIEKYLDSNDKSLDVGEEFDDLETIDTEKIARDAANANSEAADEAPIVRFVNKILMDAIKTGASDIHFEPYEKIYRVRFRTDGMLKEITRPPISIATKISARLKVMSSMDISERRIPQDGRIKLKVSKHRAIDFRVNSLPTLWGEKIVLRILDADSAKLGIDMLGYEEDQKQLFLESLSKPQGMILVTGPTGSGKTVSLYTGLNILNTTERNISTAEDPVEINLEGINQVNVNAKVGLDFGTALRSFLRQDPDVVMVGEIRDLDTASIAVKAAQTGHLVLSTLHTNSAPETLTRLRNMGVPSFNIATSVCLIIAQRLARRLCKHCKAPVNVPVQSLIEFGFSKEIAAELVPFGPKGCDKCNNEGYKGRVGVYEVVKITDAIARIIMEDGNSIEIADACRKEGFNDLRASGLLKVQAGLTSLEEVNRVTTGH